MSFEQPSTRPAIPTYRVMDSDGVIVDKDRNPPDVSDEEVLAWYRNMLTGTALNERGHSEDRWLIKQSA